jgi:hypothetical protein
MISALNMELEIVRTVLVSDVNEVSVYSDTKRDTGNYYTMVSVFSKAVAKVLAGRIAIGGLFGGNRDFVGSFTQKDALHLVFVYHPESSLANKQALYAGTFAKRREIALSFLAALAETEITGDLGRLLISDKNINLTPDGKVYLNYFLDFKGFIPSEGEELFLRDAAEYAFHILAQEYAAKYDDQVELYPNDLRLMYKKLQNKTFRSLSQILAFVRTLPDKPPEQRFGIMKLAGAAESVKSYILKKPAHLFLAIVVIMTVGYLGYQLVMRAMASKSIEENTVYVGMQQIGEVYLGEEDV